MEAEVSELEVISNIIARLEKATGPDRELDAILATVRDPSLQVCPLADSNEYFRGWIVGDGGLECPSMEYTASIDAALMLAPEGAWWSVQTVQEEGHTFGSAACGKLGEDAEPQDASTPAIALCIASLKARCAP